MTNSSTSRSYPGKVLLFGEYTILTGSRALAIPVSQWNGRFEYANDSSHDPHLIGLAKYLASQQNVELDHVRFMGDVKRGLRFNSNIPRGFGLGSSAALSAAVLDSYGDNSGQVSTETLVQKLAAIEDHFHGQSSGMDPLVSYLDKPILHESGKYHEASIHTSTDAPQLYLLNSGINRFTAPLVKLFKSRLQDQSYRELVLRPMQTHVDHAIGFLLEGAWEPFYGHVSCISAIEYSRFEEMLPESINALWTPHLESQELMFKLCGAGGGGFFMIIARPGIDVEYIVGQPVVRLQF